MSLLAIIPARGGSKGIPGKNLIKLGGRSLVARALDAARLSDVVSDIFVTTDDEAIAYECELMGIKVPYRRPAHLSDDQAGMIDVIVDAIDQFEFLEKKKAEHIVLLQPTCPFRTAKDIDECWKAFEAGAFDTMVSVHEMRESPYECVREDQKGYRLLANAKGAARRQDYKDRFHFINGAIYMAKMAYFRQNGILFKEGESGLFHMDPLHGIDIDIPADLMLAQALIGHPEFIDRMYCEDEHVPVSDLS